MSNEEKDSTKNQRELDTSRIERDILEAASKFGMIAPFGDQSGLKELTKKYGDDRQTMQSLTVVIQYLLEERYLYPFFDSKGEELRHHARGITPKGSERLKRMRHPIRTWMGANWFALVVATLTTAISIISVTTNLIVNN